MASLREQIFGVLDKEYIGDEDKEASDEHNYQAADQLISLFLERVDEIENPHKLETSDRETGRWQGFRNALQAVKEVVKE